MGTKHFNWNLSQGWRQRSSRAKHASWEITPQRWHKVPNKGSVMWLWGRGHYSSIQEKYQLIKEGILWKPSLINEWVMGLHIRARVTQYRQEVPWAPWGQPLYCRVSSQTRVQFPAEVSSKDLRKAVGLLSRPIPSRRKCRLAHLDFNLDLVRALWVVTVALNQDDHGHGQHGGKSSTAGSFM